MVSGANARAIGKNRDAAILELVEKCKFISREQVQAMLFPGQEYRQKCCQRLQKLYQAKKLKRKRTDVAAPYVYYPPGVTWNQKAEHYLIVNWIYVALVQQIKWWFKLHLFKREYFCQWDTDRLLADTLVVLNNTERKCLHPAFVEVDRADSNNKFDKVPKYTDFYKSKAWVKLWWAQPDPEGRYRFPKVLVVTDRPNQIDKILEKENTAKIRFEVVTLESVKKDIYYFI